MIKILSSYVIAVLTRSKSLEASADATSPSSPTLFSFSAATETLDWYAPALMAWARLNSQEETS